MVLNGKVSDWVPVTSGTPKGEHISPLMFALLVNDLPSVISANCLMICGNAKMFHKAASPKDVITLQKGLDAVWCWAADLEIMC